MCPASCSPDKPCLKRFKRCMYDAEQEPPLSRHMPRRFGELVDTEDAIAPGTSAQRPRLEDVAARVGLSPATVSLVLSNAPGPSAQTRSRVLRAAEELGYRPNRAASLLARRRSRLLGVLLEILNSFHAELVEDL